MMIGVPQRGLTGVPQRGLTGFTAVPQCGLFWAYPNRAHPNAGSGLTGVPQCGLTGVPRRRLGG
eukprot:655771-Pyramimonas_sp.AAC.1